MLIKLRESTMLDLAQRGEMMGHGGQRHARLFRDQPVGQRARPAFARKLCSRVYDALRRRLPRPFGRRAAALRQCLYLLACRTVRRRNHPLAKQTRGKTVRKVIVVPGRLVNVVL